MVAEIVSGQDYIGQRVHVIAGAWRYADGQLCSDCMMVDPPEEITAEGDQYGIYIVHGDVVLRPPESTADKIAGASDPFNRAIELYERCPTAWS